MIKYLTFSISITFLSWIVGMIINAFLKNTAYYKTTLSNLSFVHNEKINKNLGLGAFKWIVKNTFFRFFNPKLKLSRKIDSQELSNLRHEMTIAEISHLIAFIGVCIYAIVIWYRFNYLFALTILLVNILMNLYPTLLQQQNKRQIDKIINRLSPLKQS